MTSRDFCYWLQGILEFSDIKTMTEPQLAMVRNHLNMVFIHEIDPSHGDAAHQVELSKVHKGGGGYSKPPKALC